MSAVSSQNSIAWVNGEFTDASTISFSAFDPGLTVGLGVFDTLCGYDGVPFDFDKHYTRLAKGAVTLGLSKPDKEQIYQALLGVMAKNDFSDGKCRLRITVLAANPTQKVIVTAAGVIARDPLSTCVIASSRVNEFSHLVGIKSTCYASNLIELQLAQKAGADEAIMLNSRGELCEGTTSNVFIVKDGVLLTPPVSSGCLPGVTRATVIELCEGLKIEVKEVDLSLSDLFASEEAFLTSSLREVQSITSVDSVELPHVVDGITSTLQKAYLAKVNNGAE